MFSTRSKRSTFYVLRSTSFTLLLATCSILLAPPPVRAFTVTPALIEETIASGSIKEVTVTLLNDDNAPRRLNAAITTWHAREDGAPVFDAAAERGEAAGWVSVLPKMVQLAAGKEVSMKVRFAVPPDALAGTYPVAIVLSVEPAQAAGTIAVVQEVAILIFLNVEGTTTASGAVTNVATLRTVAWGLPLPVQTTVRNTGRTHITPQGVVRMVSMTGRIVHELPFNSEGARVLPGSTRTFTVVWDRGSAWRNITPALFGNYLVRAEVLFDGARGSTGSTTVWILSPVTLGGLGAMTAAFGLVMVKRRREKRRGKYFF